MSQKKINYLARTFDDYKSELIKFSNQYYPNMSDTYNDSSIGAWFIDLASAVGDNLSYSIDRAYQENNMNSATMKSTVLNIARSNGLKIPGAKASMCEIALSCVIPVGNADTGDISQPNWKYAPIIKRSTIVSAGDINFQLSENVDFGEQFNSDGYSNRSFAPSRNANGIVTGYTVTKTTLAINGSTRIYKKVLSSQDITPFMEVILPDRNIMNVESIIFKETCDKTSNDPDLAEFYVDEEEYMTANMSAMTYRYFEVDSLADQYRFGNSTAIDNKVVIDFYAPDMYDDFTETASDGTTKTTRYYRGEWKPIRNKFITEYTDNGYLKIIFGSGTSYDDVPDAQSMYSKRVLSKLINNDMLGVLPKEGWTMYVLYRTGGGVSSNIAKGALNSIFMTVAEFKQYAGNTDANAAEIRGKVLNSLTVTNTSPAVAGKDAPSTEEIKYLVKYNTSSQERCVTVKDYKLRLMKMPARYGSPFRAAVIEENNKIAVSMLGLNADGKLTKALPQTLVDNIIEYLSGYRTVTDYIECKSGKIYNIGFGLELFISKTYDAPTVVTNVINKVKEYMSVSSHDMGEDIFLGDLEKEITMVDGVIAIIDLSVYSLYDGIYSSDRCPFPEEKTSGECAANTTSTFYVDNGKSFKISLGDVEHMLSSDYNSMFEIYSDNDIQVKFKQV